LLVGNLNDDSSVSSATGVYSTDDNGNPTAAVTHQTDQYESDETRTIIPGGDANLGVSYTMPVTSTSDVAIEAGYQVTGYYHVIRNFDDTTSNFGMQGPYLRLTYSF